MITPKPAVAVRQAARAAERDAKLRETFAELAALSHHAAARMLTARGIKTPMGADYWTAVQVIRLRKRLAVTA